MISGKEFCFMILCFILSSMMNVMYIYNVAGRDSWFVFLMAFILAFVTIMIYMGIYRLSRGADLFEAGKQAFGKIAGTFIAVLYLGYFIYFTAFNIREGAQLILGNLMPGVSGITVAAIICLPCAYIASKGIKVISQCAFVVCFLLFILMITMFLGLKDYYSTYNLFPVLVTDKESLLRGVSIAYMLPFSELLVIPVLLPVVKKGKAILPFKSVVAGFCMGSVALGIVIFLSILAIGDFAKVIMYPTYEMTRLIEYSDNITRVEILFALPIIYMILLRCALLIYVCFIGVGRVINRSDIKRKWIVGLCMLLAFALSFNLTRSNVEMFEKTTKILPLYTPLVQLVIPFVTLICLWCRRKVMGEKSL